MSARAVHRIIGIACLFACAAQPAAIAQPNPVHAGPDLRFDHITTADGLSHRIVYDILEA